MARKTLTVKILKRTFVTGQLAEPGDIFTVEVSDGQYLINVGKAELAKPAEAKAAPNKRGTKKPAAEDDD